MLDGRIEDPWPEAVVTALREDVRQGDVIVWPDGAAYVTARRHVIFDAPDRATEENGVELVTFDPAPPYAVITTQTCDIDEQGARPRKPWFQFAPVFPLDRPSLLNRLECIELDGSGLPDGRWYADLRIELAAEKNILVNADIGRGFADEAGAVRLGERLGHLRARPALANELVETVTQALADYRSNASRGIKSRLRANIFRVLLNIEEGTRLRPVRVRLEVLHLGTPDPDDVEWFEGWYDEARPGAQDAGITLHAPQASQRPRARLPERS